jgi:hypothetical protein
VIRTVIDSPAAGVTPTRLIDHSQWVDQSGSPPLRKTGIP